ncbi:MAG: sigma-70 family RNA polymerase sigma factor [Gammaproteobacteria bacterium]|nr:sigma-70 family RNA polymerase sigma factor [Gammaproteobacteria bacterium]MDH5694412.1 sigma-70 family RNA polymerase sigma factor [Gammaproteobacteria bacterium]
MHYQSQQSQDRLLQLIAQCALKDPDAFKTLYELTSAKLFGVALRILKQEARAEEALQEACLKVWHYAADYNIQRGRPMTWLINIVRNQCLDMLRASASRQEDAHTEWTDDMEDQFSHNGEAETSEELNRLMHCMKLLNEDQQKCLLMVYHQGYTASEVSDQGKWPLGTVKTWLRRGLESIRGCLKI